MTDLPEKIINDYRAAVRRLYGDKIADKSEIYHEHGWFYVHLAKKYPDGSIGVSGYAADAFRRKNIVEMTETLKKRRRKYKICAYCGKREYDFSKLRPTGAGKYRSESQFAHNYDCTKEQTQ